MVGAALGLRSLFQPLEYDGVCSARESAVGCAICARPEITRLGARDACCVARNAVPHDAIAIATRTAVCIMRRATRCVSCVCGV